MRRASSIVVAFLILAFLEIQGSIAQPQINLDQISHRSATIKYASHRDPVFIMQIGGVGLSHGEGLELHLSSQHPTQFRLYLIPEEGPSRYRYVVLTKDRLQADLKLPLEAFDLDPQVEKGAVPAGGALLILDVPGFMRSELENSVSIGPGRITTTPTALPRDQTPPERATEEDPILDRIHGGWLGKIVGGRLGMPLEGEKVPSWERWSEFEAGFTNPALFGFGPDDDTSLMLLHLLLYQRTAGQFTQQDVLQSWEHGVAYEYLWKTERRTLDLAKKQASHETFGTGPQGLSLCARIRCDIWGYLNPSDPASAIALVEREAPLSNYGTGIQSARFIAAATSLAFNCGRVVDLLNKTLEVIGENGGEHSEMVRWLLARKEAGDTLESLRGQIDERFFDPAYRQDPDSSWAYALHNDALVILSLLFGEEDFGRSVSLASILGHDTDCNAATVGSLLGVMGGANRIPERFTSRIGDRLRAAIPEQEHWSIRRLAHLTRSLVRNTK